MTNTNGPLAGMRVIELASIIMAPLASQVLGDMGADVIKVEGGKIDNSRLVAGPLDPELSGLSLNLHRNKRSISLDLKQKDGLEALLRLVDTADVFITNMRPRALARLGLSCDEVLRDRPRLIYCEAHGYRSDSAEAERPAFDDVMQAETGLAQLGAAAGYGVRYVPTLIADKICGMVIAQAVLAALVHRQATGCGQRVEVPMFDAVMNFTLVEHLSAAARPEGQALYTRVVSPERRPFKTKDGYIAVLPYSDRDWEVLYRAVGREDELTQEWFASREVRIANPDIVYANLSSVLSERTTQEWLDLCLSIGVPVAPVPSIQEIVEDAALHRGVLEVAEHPIVGPYRSIVPAIRFEATPMSVRRPAPLVGEHTLELLRECGYEDQEVADLIALGAAVQSSRRGTQMLSGLEESSP